MRGLRCGPDARCAWPPAAKRGFYLIRRRDSSWPPAPRHATLNGINELHARDGASIRHR
ncbi:hypothetical protein DM80_4185 [Burkholderia multivorans]|nr:hypothetical protein DM80_4185 [Burkholderia multivorans]